ncbi:hypothetical protein [Streptomyces sp. NPDC000410]|uniref:hypothetical protein n=1 Tax=Streptomyces sp. NPDC000410 TaxID=3154254 RepID=UPI00331C28B6
MTTGRCARGIRAVVFAAVCVLLTALGHALTSGATVPWWSLAAGFALTVTGAWALARRERGLAVVTVAAVAAQAALHVSFSLAQAAYGHTVTRDAGMGSHAMGSHGMGFHDMGSPGSGSYDAGSHTMDSHTMGVTDMAAHHMAAPDLAASGHPLDGTAPVDMFLAHAFAAVLCALWLAHGERAVTRLRGALGALRGVADRLAAPLRLLLLLRPAVRPHRPRLRRRPDTDRRRRLRGRLLVHAITSRGPPVVPAVV